MEPPTARKMLRQSKVLPDLIGKTNVNLENTLQNVVEKLPNHTAALKVVTELVRNRHVRPEVRHYRAMILANSQCIRGSAKQVRGLLDDMEKNGIVADSGTLHAALKALAIHPDYLLRSEVVHKLRDRWLPLSPPGWHNIVAGLIREGQFEMALETLEHMKLQHVPVQNWLYSLLIYNLTDYGEFDEVLQLMRSKVEAGQNLSPNIWHHVLDAASAAMHAELTQFIWEQYVELGYMNPPYGVCNNVLAISARTGNAQLATSVFELLGDRGAAFTLNDYESLVDTYVEAHDLDSAIRILCTMGNSSVGVRDGSTRTLLSHLITAEVEPAAVWETFKRLKKDENLQIPLAVVNVALELCAHLRQADAAWEFYRELHTICPSGAETLTFNILFMVCRKTEHGELAGFFVQEMIQMKILPDRKTYESLVLLCIDFSRFGAAHKYFLEMTGSGFALSMEAKKYIRSKCYGLEDEYALKLLYDASIRKPVIRSTIGPRPVRRLSSTQDLERQHQHQRQQETKHGETEAGTETETGTQTVTEAKAEAEAETAADHDAFQLKRFNPEINDVIATSGPSSTYPKRAYRNPTEDLVRFLDSKHGEDWSIWEFRAEGTGYPDDEVYGRIHHFPWPDHHPPPFALIPSLMASMRNWLNGEGKSKRIAVVHCKAGKGRSGTVACSYLISEQGWSAVDAMKQFTERRMRAGFGAGVSIPSQVRWVGYVERWKNEFNKLYVERPVEIVEIHIWGLRKGLKVDVEGFVDEGRKIKRFYRFSKDEFFHQNSDVSSKDADSAGKEDDDDKQADKGDVVPSSTKPTSTPAKSAQGVTESESVVNAAWSVVASTPNDSTDDVILRPQERVIVPTSDVNIDFERRAVVSYTDWTMVTSVGHVWFNAYFEGGHDHNSGVFETEWDAMDGIKGTSRKGIRSLDRLKVVWKYHTPSPEDAEGKEPESGTTDAPPPGKIIAEPGPGEEVQEGHAVDWRGQDQLVEDEDKENLPQLERQPKESAASSEPEPSQPTSSQPKT
ncbi:phosphatidylinositol 3,4,5-trisphosphate 3-phosphatase and dual-specificity protein phosphatase [Arthroderma uncinatum]|uniref:phosphatidylinositol 3,4,5-trisphosphate 3-phosphatase and dual-specificity protein phosphatase n=1 Tax=Arthroderma uncinatum TaxID=74035 RepID=UPI00144AA8B8|nr:phosphatidylinositol 3,4,5-trisphosphate 3-phosphatase and dual-specificity protein phosphatase [Arthroderma uncinatum]KAF3482701.1 phosphatidylinositol 3,4,5-trisphosphate 3-phosphatase and dual-specificity protein phosphatase [Arthroderma uncinatum]